jgi:hypothetical protein
LAIALAAIAYDKDAWLRRANQYSTAKERLLAPQQRGRVISKRFFFINLELMFVAMRELQRS